MPKTILIVDDSISIRQTLARMLTANGYLSIEAVDGLDALHRLSVEVVDCVITDVNMPNMNGLELIRAIRKSGKNRFLPVIIISTETDRDVLLEGKTAGATAWIYKPFNETKVLTTIGKFLE